MGKVIVNLDKNIPSMAGMAGGSSNAAAALVAMNKLYDNPLTVDKLCQIGAKLGADVPFCIKGGTVLCEGSVHDDGLLLEINTQYILHCFILLNSY